MVKLPTTRFVAVSMIVTVLLSGLDDVELVAADGKVLGSLRNENPCDLLVVIDARRIGVNHRHGVVAAGHHPGLPRCVSDEAAVRLTSYTALENRDTVGHISALPIGAQGDVADAVRVLEAPAEVALLPLSQDRPPH